MLRVINTCVSRKFCDTSSYFVFQVFHCLFTRPNLWRCQMMILCECTDNVQTLVLGCCSTISSKASSSLTRILPDLGLSLRWEKLSLKHLKQFCGKCLLTILRLSTSFIFFFLAADLALSHFFPMWHKMALIAIYHHSLSRM